MFAAAAVTTIMVILGLELKERFEKDKEIVFDVALELKMRRRKANTQSLLSFTDVFQNVTITAIE